MVRRIRKALHHPSATASKKKDALIACCLHGCKVLDMYGSRHGGLGSCFRRRGELREHHVRKNKRHDSDDSDDDTFFDRTGTVERKREAGQERRMASDSPSHGRNARRTRWCTRWRA